MSKGLKQTDDILQSWLLNVIHIFLPLPEATALGQNYNIYNPVNALNKHSCQSFVSIKKAPSGHITCIPANARRFKFFYVFSKSSTKTLICVKHLKIDKRCFILIINSLFNLTVSSIPLIHVMYPALINKSV